MSSSLVEVVRKTYTDKSIIGSMSVEGNWECFTLEPPRGTIKPYCIPAGTYKGHKYESPSLGRTVLLLENVPGFDDIEIHNGNYPRNTHGCTVVGETCGTDFVGNSISALNNLIAKLPEYFEITYVDTDNQLARSA